MKKPCLTCGTVSQGSYCRRCGDGRLRGRKGQQLRKAMLAAFAYRCADCGAEQVKLEVHTPTGTGATTLRAICGPCARIATPRPVCSCSSQASTDIERLEPL